MRVVAPAWLAGILIGEAQGVLEWVILIGGAVTAAAIVHAKIVAPAWRFQKRLSAGIDVMLDLPDLHRQIDRRVTHLERVVEELVPAGTRDD